MVYVDKPLWEFQGQMYCHMVTDSDDLTELHRLALKIGLSKRYFKDPPPGDHPHYDVSARLRKLAIRHGATFMPGKKIARDIFRPRREKRLTAQQQPTETPQG
jgi:hypothetical protein